MDIITRTKIDWWILKILDSMQNKLFDLLAFLISYIGSGIFFFGLLIIIYYLIDKEKAKKIGIVTGVSLIFNNYLKALFASKRPFEYEGSEGLRKLNVKLDNATGSSFPSGHAQNVSALFTNIAKEFKKRWVTFLSIILIIMISISRLYLGVHFPGDVIIGLFLGISLTLLLSYLYNHANRPIGRYLILALPLLASISTLIINFNNALCADLFKSYGFCLGFLISVIIEEKYCPLDEAVSFKTKIIRLIISCAIAGALYATKFIFPSLNIFHLLRYLLVTIGGFLIVPLVIRKKNKHE